MVFQGKNLINIFALRLTIIFVYCLCVKGVDHALKEAQGTLQMNEIEHRLEGMEDTVYWTGACMDPSALQSPINIDAPFSFVSMQLDFVFRQIDKAFLSYKGRELSIEADFGDLVHENKTFSSYLMLIKCPSEHSFGPEKKYFPLEIQVHFMDSQGVRLNAAFLFNYAEKDSEFLSKLGFGGGVLENLMNMQLFEVPRSFSLVELLQQAAPAQSNENSDTQQRQQQQQQQQQQQGGSKKIPQKFFVYKGSDIRPPCQPAIWIIAYDTLPVSQRQIDDFPRGLLYEVRPPQKKKQEIFINFNPDDNLATSVEQKTSESAAEGTEGKKSQNPQKTHDTFVLIGDTTIYDPFIYTANQKNQNVKIIHNDDYIVVKASDDKRDVDKRGQSIPINRKLKEDGSDDEDQEDQVIVDEQFVDEIINDLISHEEGDVQLGNGEAAKKQSKSNKQSNGDKKDDSQVNKTQTQPEGKKDDKQDSSKDDNQKDIKKYDDKDNIDNNTKDNKNSNKDDKKDSSIKNDKKDDNNKDDKQDKKGDNKDDKQDKKGDNNDDKQDKKGDNKDDKQDKKGDNKDDKQDKKGDNNDENQKSNKKDNKKDDDSDDKQKDSKPNNNAKESDQTKASTKKNAKTTSSQFIEESEQDGVKIQSENDNENYSIENNNNSQSQEQQSDSKSPATDQSSQSGDNSLDEIIIKKIQIQEKEQEDSKSQSQASLPIQKEDYAYNRRGEWDGIAIFNTENWPELCRTSLKQSPVWLNLKGTKKVADTNSVELDYNYLIPNALWFNDGIKLTLFGKFGNLFYNNSIYKAKQIYFHHPSEHLIGDDQTRAAMELQIMHENADDNKILILSILLLPSKDESQENEFLKSIDITGTQQTVIIPLGGKQNLVQKISLSQMLQKGHLEHYIAYEGSLSSPPCTEDVTWILSREKVFVTQAQITAFQQMLGLAANVRGVHDLGERLFRTH